jgi:hypothetical protein
MKKRALLPTDHTYSSLFGACGSAGPAGSDILDKVMAEVERRNVRPNTIATNALIAALALCRREQEAMQAYLDMVKTSSEPDLCTFGALLLAVGKDKTGGLEVAKRVWSEMLASGLKPDLHSYNMALQVLRDAGLEGVMGEEPCLNAYGDPLKRVVPDVPTAILRGKVGKVGDATVLRAPGTGGKDAGGKNSEVTSQKETKIHPDEGSVAGEGTRAMIGTGKKEKGVASEGAVQEEDLEWATASQASKSVFFVRGEVEFPLIGDHSLVLHVGSLKQGGSPVARWLEKSSIEVLFASMKQNHVKPDVHTFQFLMHLTLDPAHLLVTMKERRVTLDNKIMASAIIQQTKQFHNLQGAKVRQVLGEGLWCKKAEPLKEPSPLLARVCKGEPGVLEHKVAETPCPINSLLL